MNGTRAIAGSVAARLRKVRIACSESSIPSSKLMSMITAPASTCCRATSSAPSWLPSRMSFLNFAEPVTFVRSPTFTKFVSGPTVSGSRPDNRSLGGGADRRCGLSPRTASPIARMCAGVVPQQPPTMFRNPASANSRRMPAVKAGVSSYPPISLGSPAFGCTEMRQGATRASSCTYARRSFAPSAQLSPTDSGLAWATEL